MDIEALMQQMMAGPTDEQKRAARAQALAAAGFGILGANSGSGWQGAVRSLGRGGLLGMNVYNNELANQQAAPMQNMEMLSKLMDFQGKKQAYEDSNAARDAIKSFQMPAPLPSMSPTNANAQSLASAPKVGNFERLNAMADALESKGLVQQAQTYRQLAEKYAPQYDGTETLMQDGKPVVMQKFKNRAPEAMQGYQPKPDYKQLDTGGQVGFYDPLTGTFGGKFDKSQTPDSVASNALTRRGQDLTDARSRDSNTIASGQKLSDAVTSIRKEYNALPQVQNYRAAVPMIESAKNAPDTPAGDLDVIYAVGKALDPNSVVREGELSLVIKSGSPAQKLQGYASIISGGGRLPKGQRNALMAMLENRVGQLKASADSAAVPYMKQAQSIGLPMDQIFQEDKKSATPIRSGGPAVGAVVDGHRFKGGDPNKAENWERAK